MMALFQDRNDRGIAIVIGTHKPDNAPYDKPMVEVRKGLMSALSPISIGGG
jgi:ABC-type ATPase involved in cell division